MNKHRIDIGRMHHLCMMQRMRNILSVIRPIIDHVKKISATDNRPNLPSTNGKCRISDNFLLLSSAQIE